jgi:putative FmdB family regulatory protein
MPLYEYQCEACEHRFEVIQKFSDSPIEKCPACGGPVRKLQSAPAFHLKGSGWYVTDYAKKDQAGGKSGAGKDKDSKDSGESAKADAKTEKSGKSDSSSASTTGSAPSASGSSSGSGSNSGSGPGGTGSGASTSTKS